MKIQDDDKIDKLLDFLKWLFVIVFILISVFVCLGVAVIDMNSNTIEKKIQNTKDNSKNEEFYSWYNSFDTIRGFTRDDKAIYMIEINLGFLKDKGDKAKADIEYKKVILEDLFIQWFSSQTENYLLNPKNRGQIRFILIDKVNEILSYPIYDIRFSKFRVEHYGV